MFKNIIAPVQAWLLSQGRCVGCGTELSQGTKDSKNTDKIQITCKKCKRIYLYNSNSKLYTRAPLIQMQ